MRIYGKWIAWAILVVLCLTVLSFVMGWVTFPFRYTTPERTVYNWQQFWDTYEAIQTAKANIREAAYALQVFEDANGKSINYGYGQRQEHNRLSQNLTSLKMVHNQMVADYNARMQDVTRSYIRPPELPNRLLRWEE